MLQRLSAVFLLIYLTNQVHCQGYYTIVGSKYIRPNSNYHVAVSLYDTTEPSQIRLRIVEEKQSKSAVAGTDSPVNNIEDRDVKYAKNVTVDPLTTQTVDFQTGDMLEGNYKLVADGITGMHFMSEANLDFHSKSFSILIQTDKAIYKPGDTVKFRILILDPNMKPFEIKGPVNVYITDGKGNRIKQWSDVKFNTGVYGDELPLSEFPVLGDWTISVEVMGETKKKTIEVAEYVLPKFEVSIDTPKHQIYKDGKIRATIRSKYTYGKPVRGEATVSIQPKSFGYYQPLVGDVLNRKTTKIDGKGHVEFDMKDDLKITEEYERDYDIEAIVEEELTGRKQTGTTTITLHKYKYAIKTISDQNSYKPGLPFEITIQVAHHDGSPVLDSVNKITISYGTWYRFGESNSTKIERNLDSNGMVQLTLTFPKEENGYYVNAEYLGLTERLGYYSKAESDTGAYLQAVVKTQNPTINKDVSIEVQSTDKMKYLTYQIIGRGDVLASKTEEVPDATIHVFKFLATFAMVPKARLVVYYFKDGEIVSDRLDIEFGEDLQNFIKLDMSDVQAKPGADVDITVNTRPNSYVGLLGVDQSVLLLKKGNDLSKDEVLQELGQYNQYYSRWHPMWRKKRYSYPSYDWEDFNYIGAILLTNAKHPVRQYLMPVLYSAFEDRIAIADALPALARPLAAEVETTSNTEKIEPTIRKDFPETWMWETMTNIGGASTNPHGVHHFSLLSILLIILTEYCL